MTGNIHPTAIIETGATLGKNVHIGPYSIIGAQVVLGDDVHIDAHVVVTGRTSIGARSHIFPFASIGHRPQDLKFAGEDTRLEIGEDNKIREYVTMNPGTQSGGGLTKVGSHCLFMIGSHVAHDCVLGDHLILANNATMAGHVSIGDYAILGGQIGIHQFCRIGAHAFLGFGSMVSEDVIPYGSVTGNRATLAGLNLVGLKRHGFERGHIDALRGAYKIIFGQARHQPLATRIEQAHEKYGGTDLVDNLIAFMQADKNRGYCVPPVEKE